MSEARSYFYSFVVNLSFFVQGLANFFLHFFNPKVGQNMPGLGLLKFILLGCSGCLQPASTDIFSAPENVFLLSFVYFFSFGLKLIFPLRTPMICVCFPWDIFHIYLIPVILISLIFLLESRKSFQLHLLKNWLKVLQHESYFYK